MNDGTKACFLRTQLLLHFNRVSIILSLIQYMWITSILTRSYDGLEALMQSIPALKRNVVINRRVCVIIWVSTLYFIAQITYKGSQHMVWWKIFNGLDLLVNNMAMFYIVYGSPLDFTALHSLDSQDLQENADSESNSANSVPGFLIKQQSDEISTSASIDMQPTLASEFQSALNNILLDDDWIHVIPLITGFIFYSPNTTFWLQFPQMPPFLVLSDVLERNHYLNTFVITNKKRLSVLNLNRRTIISHVDELMDMIDEEKEEININEFYYNKRYSFQLLYN